MTNSLRLLLSVFLITCVALMTPVNSAYAAGGEEETSSGSNKTLDLSNLVLPVEDDGKLINYLFVSVIITVADGNDHWKLREEAHILRDEILKEAHKQTVGLENHPMELDKVKFRKMLDTVFDREVGPHSIASIEILASDSLNIFIEG